MHSSHSLECKLFFFLPSALPCTNLTQFACLHLILATCMYELQCTVCALLVVNLSFMFLFCFVSPLLLQKVLPAKQYLLPIKSQSMSKSMYVNCIHSKLFHFYTSDFPVFLSHFSNIDTRCSWHFWEGRQLEVVSQYRDLFKHFSAAQVSGVLSWHPLWPARRGERASRATRTLWFS